MLNDIIAFIIIILISLFLISIAFLFIQVICGESPIFWLSIPLDKKYFKTGTDNFNYHYIQNGLQNIFSNKEKYCPDFYLDYKTFKKYFYLNPELYNLYNVFRRSKIPIDKDYGYIYSHDLKCKTIYKIGFKSQLQFLKASKLIVDYKYDKFNHAYQQMQNDKLKLYLENVQEQINETLNESREQVNESKILLESIKGKER